MTINKTNRRFRDPRSRQLSRYANCLVALDLFAAILTASAFWGTNWVASSFHYTMLGLIAGVAAASLGLLETARRVEVSRGFAGGHVDVAPAPQPWTGTSTPRSQPFVLPATPIPVPAAAGTFTTRAVPAQQRPAAVPVPQPAPAPAPSIVETPTPVPVESGATDQARELAGQP